MTTLGKTEDGREFPVHEGELLAWSPGLYSTIDEERAGYPRMRAVIRAMREHRPGDLRREYVDLLRAQFGMFSGPAGRNLAVLLEEAPEVEIR